MMRDSRHPVIPRLALLVPAGATLFTAAWVVLGAVSPGYDLFGSVIAPYSWVSQPVSGLGLGVTGPWMNAAFIVGGILVLVGTLAITPSWRRCGPLGTTALALTVPMGIGMAVCGLFTLESMMMHLVGFLLAIPLPAVGFLFAGAALRRRAAPFAAAAVTGGALTLVLFAVFMFTFDATGAGGHEGTAGLIQRALIICALVTQSVLAVGAARRW
jgi:heme/copper-type cytochrome/quinol oxidase subunit 4